MTHHEQSESVPVELAPGVPLQPWPTSDDWAKDNVIGREYADRLACHAKRDGDPAIIVGALRRLDASSGVDAGFLYRIAELASDGAE